MLEASGEQISADLDPLVVAYFKAKAGPCLPQEARVQLTGLDVAV